MLRICWLAWPQSGHVAEGVVATRERVRTGPMMDVSAKGFLLFRTKFLIDLFHQANRLERVERGSLLSSSCTKFSGEPIDVPTPLKNGSTKSGPAGGKWSALAMPKVTILTCAKEECYHNFVQLRSEALLLL